MPAGSGCSDIFIKTCVLRVISSWFWCVICVVCWCVLHWLLALHLVSSETLMCAGLEYNLKLFFVCELNSWSKSVTATRWTDSLVLPTCSLSISFCPQPSWWPLLDHALPYWSLSWSGESKIGTSTLSVLAQVLSREKGSFVRVFVAWLLVWPDVGTSLPEDSWLVVPRCRCSTGYC